MTPAGMSGALFTVSENVPHTFVIPSEARNLSFFLLELKIEERCLASLGMAK
jgi:hypothetical protein